jgi:hypothetical protein
MNEKNNAIKERGNTGRIGLKWYIPLINLNIQNENE